jgi:hypothetical protein
MLFLNPAAFAKPFGIQVIDDQTSRGVPMVALTTTSQVKFYTDSAGWAAIDDPAMLGRKVYFDVSSDGYEMPPDGFGSRGVALDVTDGGQAFIKIKRINIAERLYRVTGEGIYRDSIMLGKDSPIAEPLLNAQVTGQDSVEAAVYQNKIYWFYGDTARQSYKLGQYSTSGATSELAGHGGLDPSVGINLNYFVDAKGFSRPMTTPRGSQAQWLDGLTTIPDANGRLRLIGVFTVLQHLGKVTGGYLAAFDDEKQIFEPVMDIDPTRKLRLCGHPFHYTDQGVDYLYFGYGFANMRVRADWKSVTDPAAYEAFVPQGHGWGWQRGGDPLDWKQVSEKLKSGQWRPADVPTLLCDAATGKPLIIGGSSIAWNEHRRKWTMIAGETAGTSSYLGETWYAEADHPEGPWGKAVKIVTHDHYSFYNPTQFDFLAQQGGRFIYFQGTYATTFSRNDKDATPRYEYNQIMYRLDVDDPHLKVLFQQ